MRIENLYIQIKCRIINRFIVCLSVITFEVNLLNFTHISFRLCDVSYFQINLKFARCDKHSYKYIHIKPAFYISIRHLDLLFIVSNYFNIISQGTLNFLFVLVTILLICVQINQ